MKSLQKLFTEFSNKFNPNPDGDQHLVAKPLFLLLPLKFQMPKKGKLSKSMTKAEFVNGYWYASEIKSFAKSIGIQGVAKLRKDELESLILEFLRSGQIKSEKTPRNPSGPKDSDQGLSRKLSIVRYTNNPETKSFLLDEARKIDSGFRPKSGAINLILMETYSKTVLPTEGLVY